MIVFGVALIIAGLVTYLTPIADAGGSWWLLPAGLVAAGAGVVIAGGVAIMRRRLAPLRRARGAGGGAAGGGPIRRLRAVPAMVRASWRGELPELPRYQPVLWLVALVYLVSPIDIVPELLPLIGISDDIGVGAWLLTSLYAEAGNYVGRETERRRGVDA